LTQGPDPTIFDLSAQFHKHCNDSYPNPAFVFFVLFVVEQGLFLTTKDTKSTKVDSTEIHHRIYEDTQ